jgi:hypothetical protein
MTTKQAEFLKLAFQTTMAQMLAKYGAIEAIDFDATKDTTEAKV